MRIKSIASTSFLASFDRLKRSGETQPGQHRWTAHGLQWSRGRHVYYGPEYSVTIEVIRVSAPGTKGWALMVVREGWWVDDGVDPIKTREWAHLVKGDRTKALADLVRLFDELQPQPGAA